MSIDATRMEEAIRRHRDSHQRDTRGPLNWHSCSESCSAELVDSLRHVLNLDNPRRIEGPHPASPDWQRGYEAGRDEAEAAAPTGLRERISRALTEAGYRRFVPGAPLTADELAASIVQRIAANPTLPALDVERLATILRDGNIGCEDHRDRDGGYHLASMHKEDAEFILARLSDSKEEPNGE